MTFETLMRSDTEWTEEVKRILRAEMVRRGITYDELTKKLAAIGVDPSSEALRMTVRRGRTSCAARVRAVLRRRARVFGR